MLELFIALFHRVAASYVCYSLSLFDYLSLLKCFFRFVYSRSRYSSKQETETSGKSSQTPKHRGDLFGLSIVKDSYCVLTLRQVTSGIDLIPQTNNAVRVSKHAHMHLSKIVPLNKHALLCGEGEGKW